MTGVRPRNALGVGGRLVVLLRLSLRNLGRQARRSILTASAMVVGLALLVISRALGDGSHESWIDQAVRAGAGHVTVETPGYRSSGDLADRLPPEGVAAARAALADARVAPFVSAVAPRLSVSGLASSPSSALPVAVQGVDPAIEAVFSTMPEKVVEGRYLEPGDRLEAFVGANLVERLDLSLGARLVLTTQDASGEIVGQLVRVRGIFRTGIPEIDEGLIHIPVETARQWLSAPGSATQLAILLHDSRETRAAAIALRSALDSAAGLAVLSWRETAPQLDAAVRIDDAGSYVFHGVLFAIVALAILNAILMSVLNREREFGVLQALGLTTRETGAVVFTEGVLLTFASGIVGVALGFAVTWIFWRNGLDLSSFYDESISMSGIAVSPIVVPSFQISQILENLVFTLFVGVAASIYPALQAARIDVAQAMKFEA
jgi:ABC-type lipoprotein release transport system permease subunit